MSHIQIPDSLLGQVKQVLPLSASAEEYVAQGLSEDDILRDFNTFRGKLDE